MKATAPERTAPVIATLTTMAALALVTPLPGCGSGADDSTGPSPDEKIDPTLPRASRGEGTPVIVLGRTQLIEPPDGFARF
ncbi:MAG: hypothetical protein GWN85_25965, partial [Gemmatimonadetes bacterium]|nr:hypothetical protein [Gemmatimonadota bacterium]NIS29163.1 hypothetical protein [Actinomycetota bacterium]NIU68456.1 hypothetical protein [Actinomycetota bacterium]NIW30283.1 hypothetical protein [Actinomycetota bacterium]NIX22701.1 hypothetical protein [Actinomycetota bacterium]